MGVQNIYEDESRTPSIPPRIYKLNLKRRGIHRMDWTSLKSLDLDCLDALDITEFEQPFDDDPDVQGDEVDVSNGLDSDRSFFRTATTHTHEDLRARPEAVRHLQRLPVQGESFHAIISGKYALWDLVPAMLEKIAPQTISELIIATLSFSKTNAAEMLALLDTGRVKRMSLLVSHYFKGTNREIYDSLVPHLLERGQKVQAMRTHAKIILITTSEAVKYTVESSANARSCKNVEQFCMIRDDALHDFHRGWISELIEGRGTHGWKADAGVEAGLQKKDV